MTAIAEQGVQLAVRVRDRGEGKLALVGQHVLDRGVEHHDLADARRHDLVVPADHRAQVQVADGAAGETPELQVRQALAGRYANLLRTDRGQLARCDGVARAEATNGREGELCRVHGIVHSVEAQRVWST